MSALQQFAAVLPSRAEVHPPTVRCCSPLTRRSPPFNSSLLFSPHAPKSALQQFAAVLPSRTEVRLQHFAAVLPSRAEVHPSTVRCCSPLTHRSPPFNSSLLFSPHALKSAFNSSLLFSPHAPKSTLQQFAAVLPSRTEVRPSTVRCCSPLTH